jgi:hypothetical protein
MYIIIIIIERMNEKRNKRNIEMYVVEYTRNIQFFFFFSCKSNAYLQRKWTVIVLKFLQVK